VDALPASTNEKVVLQEEKGGIFLSKKFSGVATEKSAREVYAELRKCAARDGLETRGNAGLAQYNDPFTYPLVRKNEVSHPGV
jgi:SOUL heme-binding protein.